MRLNLSELKIDKTAIIAELKSNEFTVILKERGFNVGKDITLIHSDIFNSVKVFLIDKVKFALRKSEYELIEVDLF